MKGSQKFKRRKIFIDKDFQTRFIINVYIIVILLIVLLGFLIVYFSSREMGESVYSKITTIKSTKEIIFPVILRVGFIVIVIGFIIAGARFLILSHKIAGPMFRFKRVLKELKNGDLTLNIRFRRKDELQDVAQIFSMAVKELNRRITEIKENSEKMEKILSKGILKQSDIKNLISLNKAIKEVLSKFKL